MLHFLQLLWQIHSQVAPDLSFPMSPCKTLSVYLSLELLYFKLLDPHFSELIDLVHRQLIKYFLSPFSQ